MILPRMRIGRLKRRSTGTAAVEFALIAMIFLMLVIGIMELGRLMYVWNTVQEITRNAARMAVVRDFATAVPDIQRAAVFRAGATGDVQLPGAGEIGNVNVRITYLNGAMNPADPLPTDPADNVSACNDVDRVNSCIRFVQAQLSNADGTPAQFVPMVDLFSVLGVAIPNSTVVMPAESLGFTYSP